QQLLAIANETGPEAEKAEASLRGLAVQGKSTATAHLFLGMHAQKRGKLALAREHFEQAYQLGPQMPVVINNLAWTLAQSEPIDLPRALDLINAALERFPDQ